MASGDTLLIFTPLSFEPPSSVPATPNLRNGHPILQFDAATKWAAIFSGILPRHYSGAGLTVTIIWTAATATSGNVIWNSSIEREDTGTDLDADSFASAQAAAAAACSATSGAPAYTNITHSSGANMDSLAAGEGFRLKIERDAAAGGDTMAGNAEIMAVEIRET